MLPTASDWLNKYKQKPVFETNFHKEQEKSRKQKQKHPFYDNYKLCGDMISKHGEVEVWKCKHRETGTKYLVKIIISKGRLLGESKEVKNDTFITKRLDHRNIVKTYEVITHIRRIFVVTEYHRSRYLLDCIGELPEFTEL
jgi:hypothetical protein